MSFLKIFLSVQKIFARSFLKIFLQMDGVVKGLTILKIFLSVLELFEIWKYFLKITKISQKLFFTQNFLHPFIRPSKSHDKIFFWTQNYFLRFWKYFENYFRDHKNIFEKLFFKNILSPLLSRPNQLLYSQKYFWAQKLFFLSRR